MFFSFLFQFFLMLYVLTGTWYEPAQPPGPTVSFQQATSRNP